MKATWVSCNGESIAIYKDPKTDNGTKKSAKGILRVIKEDSEYTLLQEQDSFLLMKLLYIMLTGVSKKLKVLKK